jgi:hypothetical protein
MNAAAKCILGLGLLVAIQACQPLYDLTLGAYRDCDASYSDAQTRQACKKGVEYLSEEAGYRLNSPRAVTTRDINAAQSKAKSMCADVYPFFRSLSNNRACMKGIDLMRTRLDRALNNL